MTSGARSGLGRVLACAAVALAALAGPSAMAAGVASGSVASEVAFKDRLVLRNGRVIEGTILEETLTDVVMEVTVAGITGRASYPKADILEVQRAGAAAPAISGGGGGGGDAGGAEPTLADLRDRLSGGADPGAGLSEADLSKPSVYHMVFNGWFGSDIHPIIVKDMLEDAREHRPDFLIVEIDRSWQADAFSELPDDLGDGSAFDEFGTADEIEALFTKEMPRTWEKIPHVVVWVKSAMGGAAFLPFIGDEIYFHPEGRMGGIGNLGELFDGVGDHVVRQKQRSLRLARAQGMAIAGGYDYRIVTAMAMRKYELSYRLEGGVAVLFEGLARPGASNEFTLTENGTIDSNRDSLQDLVRGTGNDVLTLKAEVAKQLGISRGTAETLDDVLSYVGVLRNHRMVDGRAGRLMEDWQRRLDQLGVDLPRMWREYNEVAIGQNGVRDERGAIARRDRILKEIRAVLLQYGDSIRVAENFGGSGPPPAAQVPPLDWIEVTLEQLSIQRRLID